MLLEPEPEPELVPLLTHVDPFQYCPDEHALEPPPPVPPVGEDTHAEPSQYCPPVQLPPPLPPPEHPVVGVVEQE